MNIVKFTSDDIIYEVNEAKQTVTARIEDTYSSMDDVMASAWGPAVTVLLMQGVKLPELPERFVATARCEGETFDIEKGKRVARLKLLRKVTAFEKRYAEYVIKNFKNVTEQIGASLNKKAEGYTKRLTHILAYLDKE